MKDNTDLSIIIVNYNSLDFLKSCLDSIPGSISGIDAEVIVVDNASSDGSAAYLRNTIPGKTGFRYLINESNRGFSIACNQGAELAEGRYLLFLNPDCRFADVSIKNLLDFYHMQETRGMIGAAGARVLNSDGTLQLSCRSFPTLARQFYESFFLHRIFKKSRIFGSYFMTWWNHRDTKEVDWISGSFILVSRDAFFEIGKFSEKYFMYSEDTDLCLRLKRKGYSNFYYPLFTLTHEDGAVASRDRIMRETGIWKSRVTYFKNNYSRFHAKVVSFLYFSGVINRIIVFLVLSLLRPVEKNKEKVTVYARTIKRYLFG